MKNIFPFKFSLSFFSIVQVLKECYRIVGPANSRTIIRDDIVIVQEAWKKDAEEVSTEFNNANCDALQEKYLTISRLDDMRNLLKRSHVGRGNNQSYDVVRFK